MNNFDVLKEMGQREMDISLAGLDNVLRAKKVRAGTQITIGFGGDVVGKLLTGKLVGGLVLADKDQFNAVRSEMGKRPVIKTREELEAEIKALEATAKDYDTERQSNDTCLAAGAHDALRWALGLAEESISEGLKRS